MPYFSCQNISRLYLTWGKMLRWKLKRKSGWMEKVEKIKYGFKVNKLYIYIYLVYFNYLK